MVETVDPGVVYFPMICELIINSYGCRFLPPPPDTFRLPERKRIGKRDLLDRFIPDDAAAPGPWPRVVALVKRRSRS